ncbi:MAG: LacI family DNA-binding transcriptional regulator [bacterium]
MPTIYDVAERAGVSAMTVSRVINGKRDVKPSTREKVMKAIEELGYVPNSFARSFVLQKTSSIGLVISDITNPFFTTLARGVEDTAMKNQFNVILCNTDEDPEKEQIYLEVLLRKRIDGIILASASGKRGPLKNILMRDVPLVLIDRKIEHLDSVDVVRGDSELGSYLLTRHLVSLGHKRIGVIVGSRHISTALERVEGYKRALKESGIPIEEDLIRFGRYSKEDGYKLAKALLTMEKPPTAIFGGNNFIAIGAIKAIRELGLRVPEDVGLVSFDDIESLSEVYPFFTVVTQPAYSMGVIATELLIRRIEGRDKVKEKREVVLQPELIIGESAGEKLRKGE